mmetsp:Transcript_15286/g.59743  ORF Transcript_15286/g.59743 Transcript_15286/m.59743 type:complete len:334 (+) Transcript_15286:3332-4333(+)
MPRRQCSRCSTLSWRAQRQSGTCFWMRWSLLSLALVFRATTTSTARARSLSLLERLTPRSSFAACCSWWEATPVTRQWLPSLPPLPGPRLAVWFSHHSLEQRCRGHCSGRSFATRRALLRHSSCSLLSSSTPSTTAHSGSSSTRPATPALPPSPSVRSRARAERSGAILCSRLASVWCPFSQDSLTPVWRQRSRQQRATEPLVRQWRRRWRSFADSTAPVVSTDSTKTSPGSSSPSESALESQPKTTTVTTRTAKTLQRRTRGMEVMWRCSSVRWGTSLLHCTSCRATLWSRSSSSISTSTSSPPSPAYRPPTPTETSSSLPWPSTTWRRTRL